MGFPARYRFTVIPPKFWTRVILLVTILFLVIMGVPTLAQTSSPTGNQIDGYPIVLNGQELFRVRQGWPGVALAAERAQVINDRLAQIANDPSIHLDTVNIETETDRTIVKAGDKILFTVFDRDSTADQTRQQVAEKAVRIIQSAIQTYREERSAERLARGVLLAVLSTIFLIGFLIGLQRFVSQLLIRIKAARQADRLDLRIQHLQLLNSDATSFLLTGLLKLLRLVLILGSFYLYLPFVLSQFPATKKIGDSIFGDIVYRANLLTSAFISYLPNLVTIIIIVWLTYYLVQFANLIITELGREDFYPWFYPEWIQPTKRLTAFLLIAIACVVIAPYLPGFSSPAFQGVSLFLGALFTLGSSSAVANALAGIILIYTRAFRIGDVIRIGDITGEVVEKSLFVTRLLTFKQEMITIPNASVLGSNVINFKAVLREARGHLVLHTTITLGYDVPWRKIHDVLIQAAQATPGIVSTPAPFVLQTGLNDYNVSYELNACSDRPEIMPQVYSELHQNIQDYCNQAGIEILSPAYTSLRDGNHTTIPESYLPPGYISPTFQIRSRDES